MMFAVTIGLLVIVGLILRSFTRGSGEKGGALGGIGGA